MSVQSALWFIAATRQRPALREAIRQRDERHSLAELVRLGADAGFSFSAAELQTAFRHDWAMRQVRSGTPRMSFPVD